jgi:acyl transferase domain-containing protein
MDSCAQLDAALSRDASKPIAIVGIACRFPGDAADPEKLWELISDGRSALSEKISEDRFNVDAFYHPNGEHKGTTNVRAAHLLKENPGRWDAPFFSITAQEARSLDPQQGMALEVAYEALENGRFDS